jgi:sigma-B regulation protein RsbU (phosphoserine phosphatase)
MTEKDLAVFKTSLLQHRTALLEWLDSEPAPDNVHLGGSAVQDVRQMMSELKRALERIDTGTFGSCTQCEGEVERERLELDCTTQVCLAHYSDAQIEALERDLELAARVQEQLLPCCIPVFPDIEIAAHTASARIVSGDYYDFFVTGKNEQGVILADVMGKGLPASMLMSNLQASLRILAPEYDELHDLMARLNTLFKNNLRLIKFISIFLAKVDLSSSTLWYSNAGHNPGLLWKSKSQSIHWLNPTGPAIGLTQHASFTSGEVNFGSGDLFVFYTDGLVEARNSHAEEFGQDGLLTAIRSYHGEDANGVLNGLVKAARAFAGEFHDDVTILVMKVR